MGVEAAEVHLAALSESKMDMGERNEGEVGGQRNISHITHNTHIAHTQNTHITHAP